MEKFHGSNEEREESEVGEAEFVSPKFELMTWYEEGVGSSATRAKAQEE